MTELVYSLYMLYAFEEGIIPLRNFDARRSPEEVRADLAAMSPEDARKAKRKFRKMWRKHVKTRPSQQSRKDAVDDFLKSRAMMTLLGQQLKD